MERKISAFDSEQRKVIKTFFSLKQSLAALREIPGGVLETTSVEELYNLVIETIDLVRYSRNFVQTDMPKKNPRLVSSSNTSYENVGGISVVRYKQNLVPYFPEEAEKLSLIQQFLIHMRNSLIHGQSLPNNRFFVKNDIRKESTGRNQEDTSAKRRHFFFKRR